MTQFICCAVYARYSTEMQKATSIEDQIRNCRAFAAAQHWDILENHIYCDKAISGSSITPRDEFNKLLQVALSPNVSFQYILVDDTSRVARNLREALQIFEDLLFKNIFVYYVSQGIDTKKEFAPEMITLHGMIDSLYIRELAKKTHSGIEGQIRRGYNGGGRPFGYKSVPVLTDQKDRYGNPTVSGYKLAIDPEEAKTIVKIFELIALEHYSYKKIVKFLNECIKYSGGPKSPRGKLWNAFSIGGHSEQIDGILNNMLYVGQRIWNRRSMRRNPRTGKKIQVMNPREKWITIPAPELRIISDDLWEKAKQRQKDVKNKVGNRFATAKALHSTHLLTQISVCAECGSTVGIVSSSSNKSYGCATKKNMGDSACKNTVKIRTQFFEECIISKIGEFLLDKDELTKLSNEITQNLGTYLRRMQNNIQKDELQKQIELVRKEIENISSAIAAGIFTETTKNLLLHAEKREKELMNQSVLASIDNLPEPSHLINFNNIESYFQGVRKRLLDPKTMTESLYSVIERIIVGRDDAEKITVEIHEKTNNTIGYIFDIIAKSIPGIRLETGARFQPYSQRIFKFKLIEISVGRNHKRDYIIVKNDV